MAADSIHLKLHVPRVRVIGTLKETPEELEIVVESPILRGIKSDSAQRRFHLG